MVFGEGDRDRDRQPDTETERDKGVIAISQVTNRTRKMDRTFVFVRS